MLIIAIVGLAVLVVLAVLIGLAGRDDVGAASRSAEPHSTDETPR
ncbi:hypothetical protein [Pseudonocardia lacus]|nr:hypothetical protein [Pseudonocardia lacus]